MIVEIVVHTIRSPYYEIFKVLASLIYFPRPVKFNMAKSLRRPLFAGVTYLKRLKFPSNSKLLWLSSQANFTGLGI